MMHLHVVTVGRTWKELDDCLKLIFKGEYNKKQSPMSSFLDFPLQSRDAIEHADNPQMMNLKEHRVSDSMETDTLPDYDSLDNEDGGSSCHRNSNHSSWRNDPTHTDSSHQIKRLKSGGWAGSSADGTASLPSASSVGGYSIAEPCTSRLASRQDSNAWCHVHMVAWDRDRGIQWSAMPILSSVFLLVVDMLAVIDNMQLKAEYLDMVRTIGDLCRHKGVHESVEYPKLYLLYHINSLEKHSRKAFQENLNNFHKEINSMASSIHIDPTERTMNLTHADKDEPKAKILRQLLTSTNHIRSPSSNIPLVKPIFEVVTKCEQYTMNRKELQLAFSDQDDQSIITTLRHLQKMGVLVYLDTDSCVWTKPEVLTQACEMLRHVLPDNLTKGAVLQHLSDKLHMDCDDARLCYEALEKLGIVAAVRETDMQHNNGHSLTNGELDERAFQQQCISAVNLEVNSNDPFKNFQSDNNRTPVLKYCLRESKPPCVFEGICLKLVQKGWQPVKSVKSYKIYKTWATFVLEDTSTAVTRIYLSANRSMLHVIIVEHKSQKQVSPEKCAKVRMDIEDAIMSVAYNEVLLAGMQQLVTRHIRCGQATGPLNGNHGWIPVNELQQMLLQGDRLLCEHQGCSVPHYVTPSELLLAWFPNNQRMVKSASLDTSTDDEMSVSCGSVDLQKQKEAAEVLVTLSDGLMSKISKCFGRGWEQFFVENGLEQIDVDHAKADHSSMTRQVFDCLQTWKRKLGEKASMQLLRRKLKKCDDLTFSFDQLDKILAEQADDSP